MALRTIRKDTDPILRKTARRIEKFDHRLSALADDMIETMHDADGIGLAAPQIGILKRIFVIDLYDEDGPRVFINPQIIAEEGRQYEIEGCLSLPGLQGRHERPQTVTLEYQDLDGAKQQLTGEGLLARAICHENDHLNGVLFTDDAEMLTDEEVEALYSAQREDA